MANIQLLIPLILKWEGGSEDVVERILRPHYRNRRQADRIDSQVPANILVDRLWSSGRYVERRGIFTSRHLSFINHPLKK